MSVFIPLPDTITISIPPILRIGQLWCQIICQLSEICKKRFLILPLEWVQA